MSRSVHLTSTLAMRESKHRPMVSHIVAAGIIWVHSHDSDGQKPEAKISSHVVQCAGLH